MAKTNSAGIYQDKNGNWYYRLKFVRASDGKLFDTTCKKDADGKPFKTKKDCMLARDTRRLELMKEDDAPKEEEVKVYNATFLDVWNRYLETEAKEKEQATVVKHSSVWRNHIKDVFADRKMTDVTVTEMHDFLLDKYLAGYGYGYVESMLKVFYLLYGVAYRNQMIDYESYRFRVGEKNTKLRMPEKKTVEDEDDNEDKVRVFYPAEVHKIFELVKGSNLETAFMLGYYCGMRVSEVFGLRWSDIDWDAGVIKVRHQLCYYKKVWYLKKPKTKNSIRNISMPDVLVNFLVEKYKEQQKKIGDIGYKNTERVLDVTKKIKGEELVGADFVNRTSDGKLLTANSIKYYSKKIKDVCGISDFKFRSLRKTHLSQLAAMNTPMIELMHRAGHSRLEITEKYYLACSAESKRQMIQNINRLNTEEKAIEVLASDGAKQLMKEEEYLRYINIVKNIPHVNESKVTYKPYSQEYKLAI